MKIAPIDIAHKSFGRKMMGFDPEEVSDFLRMISAEMETLIREKNQLKEMSREKDLQIIDFKERDELLKNTITTATKMSDRIQSDAEREAKLILSDAHQHAEIIVRDARDSLKKIYQEIADLKKIRMQFENNLKAMIESHLTMMEQAHRIMPSPQFSEEMSSKTANNGASSQNGASVHGQSGIPSGYPGSFVSRVPQGNQKESTVDLSHEIKSEIAQAMQSSESRPFS